MPCESYGRVFPKLFTKPNVNAFIKALHPHIVNHVQTTS